jgi:hypothetical protein
LQKIDTLRYDDPDMMLFNWRLAKSLRGIPTTNTAILGYYFFKYIIERHKQKSLAYAHETFYGPLGMARLRLIR